MKKKILIIVGLIVVLFGVLVVLPNLVDWNKFKPQFADGVKAATGQDVTIEGELTFKLLPSPAVTASRVSLANIEGGVSENFIELDGLDLRVELVPLISGDLQITSLVLEGGKIFLERDAEGNANWEALFAGGEQPEGEERQVTLESFILENTDISFVDLEAGTSQLIEGISADLVVTSLAGPFDGQGNFTYRGTEIDFDINTGVFSEGATVPLNLALIPAEDGPGLIFDGSFVEESGFMAISGNLTIGGENAENLAQFMAHLGGMDALPDGDWENEFSGGTTVLALVGDEKSEINLDPFHFTFGDTIASGTVTLIQEAELDIKATLEADRFNLDLWLSEGGEDSFALPDGITADLDIKVGEAIYNKGPMDDVTFLGTFENQKLKITKLQAAIPGNTSMTLYGTLEARSGTPVFAGNLDLESRTFRALLDWFEVDHSSYPRNRLSRFSFSGKVRLADPVLEIERATIGLDSTRFTGGMTFNLQDLGHFAIVGSVTSLDIDSYFPDLTEEEVEVQTLTDRVETIEENLKVLKDYEGFISLQADSLKMLGANIRGVSFNGNISNGVLNVAEMEAEAFEGAALSFKGKIGSGDTGATFDMTLTISSPNLSTIMRWAAVESPFEDRVVPSGNLNARMRGSFKAAAVGLAGQFSGLEFEAGGQVQDLAGTPMFDINLQLAHGNTVEFIRKFSPDYFPARSALGPFSLNATLKGGLEDYTLDQLDMDLGPANFQGTLRTRVVDGRTSYRGELATRNIVLDEFMAPVDAGLEEVLENGGERWSDDQWDVAFIRDHDLDVSLMADSLNFRTYRFLNPKVKLVSRSGVLSVENLTAGFLGGTIAVDVTMDARQTPLLDVDLDLQGVSTEQLLRSSADIDQLTGTMSLSGNFKGNGYSQKAIISTLSGEAMVSTVDGLIKGIDMTQLSERMDTLDTLGAFKSVLDTALDGGETAYQSITTNTVLRDGVIIFEAIDGDIEATEVGGRGRINLPNWDMNISGAIRLQDQPDVPAIGYNMAGPIDQPEVSYDYIALTAFMTKRFTATLFQQLLATPEEEPLTEGEGVEGETPPPAETEEEAEPTPEEQIIKGLFDLITGGEKEPEEEEGEGEEEDGGGG